MSGTIATLDTAAHRTKVKALEKITGPRIAQAVAAHLDDAGVDALIASLRGMPGEHRQEHLAELKSWSARGPKGAKP